MSEDYISEFMKENRWINANYNEKDGLEILLINTEQKGMAGHFIGLKELDAYIEMQKKAAIIMIHTKDLTKLYGLIINNNEVEEVLESKNVRLFIETHFAQYPFELMTKEHIGEGGLFNKPVKEEIKGLIINYYKSFNFDETRKDELAEMIEMLRKVEKMI